MSCCKGKSVPFTRQFNEVRLSYGQALSAALTTTRCLKSSRLCASQSISPSVAYGNFFCFRVLTRPQRLTHFVVQDTGSCGRLCCVLAVVVVVAFCCRRRRCGLSVEVAVVNTLALTTACITGISTAVAGGGRVYRRNGIGCP